MFSIIISEKGGAERTEGFDKSEINVGRVQGNDLVLPKGNVSKHHARLLFRDGRFIVTDLKSTNGTYVNGRKIAQATIVREGDKIYIGDFVLRLESASAVAEPSPPPPPPEEESPSQEPEASESPKPAVPAVVTMKAPSIPPGAPAPRPQPSNVTNAPPPLPPLAEKSAPGDETSAAIGRPPRMPPSPAAVGGLRGGTLPLQQGLGASPRPVPAPPPPPAAPPPPPPSAPSATRAPEVAPSAPKSPPSIAAPPSTRGGVSVPPPAAVYRTLPPRSASKDAPAQAARRLAMTMLMGRIADAVDLSPLNEQPIAPDALASQIERIAREQAEAMRAEEEAPAEVDLEALARDAHRELVGTGPLAALLEDDDASEIHVSRFDRIDVVRGDQRTTVEGAAFTSDDALKRAIARLVAPVGGWPPGETLLDRRLARAHLVAVAPPSSSGHAVSIRKRSYLDVRLELLAASGTLSKPMEQFLEACVAGHVNVLVAGNSTLASALLLSALTALSSADERVCVAQDTFDLAASDANAVHVGLDAASIRAAAKLHPQRLVVAQLSGTVASATIDAIADGATGVVCGLVAPTLRQGLTRLAAQLVLHRPALTLETARELVAELFDVAIEVNATPDGRTRVLRIAELGTEGSKGLALRDLFTFSDAGDGTFAATGTVPRLAGDLASRGIKLDPGLFKRGR